MIPLGTIPILGTHSVGEARSKILRLARALDLGDVVATRLATAVSEVSRRLAGHPDRPRIAVGLETGTDATGLTLDFELAGDPRNLELLRAVFDDVRAIRTAEGRPALRARRNMAVTHLDAEFLARERTAVESPSRVALLEEVRARNRELEQYRQELEQTVAERTAELREATAAAEQANLAKSTFLSSMSHELRTPLNGVLGYAQLLMRDRDVTPGQRERLDAIASCGKHLLSLINDVLDLSKIEAGRLELDLQPVPLRQLLDQVADISRPRAEARGLSFVLSAAPDLPRVVRADAAKLRQVLVNLLGNAVKFTDEGSVELSVSRTPGGVIQFAVQDTGPGIEPDQLEAIFDPFRQAEAGMEKGGTGLGLAISRRLVEAFGGHLDAESEVGRGSCFRVHLPLEEIEEPAASTPEPQRASRFHLAPGQTIRVLVADDVDANRDILGSLLRDAGFETVTASDGREALGTLEAGGIDLALVDLRMPEMDGFELAEIVRGRDDLRALPMVAVSANVFDDTPGKVQAAGFDGFIAKPFHMLDVYRALEQHLRVAWREETANPDADDGRALTAARADAIARRLLEAVEEGDVGALAAYGEELGGDEEVPRRTVETITRLTREFDLEGLRALATKLTGGA